MVQNWFTEQDYCANQTEDNKKTKKLKRDRELPMTKNVKCEIFDEH